MTRLSALIARVSRAPRRAFPAVLVLIMLATPARADDVWRWRPFIADASERFGIPVRWIERVMRAESGGKPVRGGLPVRSPAGAMGLMQLMPATWSDMRLRHGLGDDPDDPRDNILAGTAYLRAMYDRFGYPGLFGAYNAGPARYAAHLAGHSPLPGETIAYLATVAGPYERAPSPGRMDHASPAGMATDRMFALRSAPPEASGLSRAARNGSGLFAIVRDGQ